METLPTLIHRIDHEDIIYYVNDEWIKFAEFNDSERLHEQVIGRSMWEFITSDIVCDIYKSMVEKVRKTTIPIIFNYRCDAPNTIREVKMSILLIENGHIEFQNVITREKNREPITLLDTQFTRNKNFVKMCSFCNSIETVCGWMEIQNALDIITTNENTVSKITHGICDDCFKKLEQDINEREQKRNIQQNIAND